MNSNTFSHFSIVKLFDTSGARLVFPGITNVPDGCHGYVRSTLRRETCHQVLIGERTLNDQLPFRDYPDQVLSDSNSLLSPPFEAEMLVISCRNTLNESGYGVRVAGKWIFRSGEPLPEEKTVAVEISPEGLRFKPLGAIRAGHHDAVVGLPLVSDGKPHERQFFVAHCSDVSHSYEVHPNGMIGPSPPAWQELEDTWHRLRDEEAPEDIFFREMEAVALRHGAQESSGLLHSIIAETLAGEILLVAVCGSLHNVALFLAQTLKVRNAVLLDNGGSVGWIYHPKRAHQPVMLLAGPNWRPRGTVFMLIPTKGFLQPAMHPLVMRADVSGT